MDDQNLLGKNISYLRRKRGFTLEEVGDKIGVGASQVGAYEKGRSKPKHEVLENLLALFEVSPNDLMRRDIELEGTEALAPNPAIDLNQIVGMYQREIKVLTDQVGHKLSEDKLKELLDDLERVAPDQIKSFREKHDI